MEYVFITDPVYTALASARPAVAWGIELIKMGHAVTLLAPTVNRSVYNYLSSLGFRVKAKVTDSGYSALGSLINIIKGAPASVEGVSVNFSNTIRVESTLFYFQGFLSDMAWDIGGLLNLLIPAFSIIDAEWVKAMKRSKAIVASCMLAARQLESRGIKPSAVIHPSIQSSLVKGLLEVNEPGSYYLVYSGKETDWGIVKWFMRNLPGDWRAFGKFSPPKGLGVEKIPPVPEDDLPKAVYAGARLILFTYGHEPFGYVTVEGALAGKPVIAVGPSNQGPWEQWKLGYPIQWLPYPMLKLPQPPGWGERVWVASRHDAAGTVKLLLSNIPNPHS